MNKMQALHQFWSGFSIPAYEENSVPDNVPLPYLTYEATSDDFGHTVAQTASLWYRSSSWSDIISKETEISQYITRGGRMIAFDGGSMWIQRATPWAQRMGDPSDENIRRIVLNVTIEYLN